MLNDKQNEAVTHIPANMLVLAGAGSGKTRVLVHRIAHLMAHEQYSPFNILAVTFTNKAASEMRQRIETMLDAPTRGLWVGTFHGIAHRLLRIHHKEAGLPELFQVLDSDDQLRLIKRCVKDNNLDDKQFPPKQIQYFINQQKDEGLRPYQIESNGDYMRQKFIQIYTDYQSRCDHLGCLDFAELLLKIVELWQNNTELLAHYQQRFKCILVDEFQDTNTIQYHWIKLLNNGENYTMVVGDDDQSIYGWRGARIENVKRFQKEFNDVATIRLEQNYRSTQTIINAANAVIELNEGRMGKKLWTAGPVGDPINLYGAFNEIDEASYIAQQICKKIDENDLTYKDIAILYRSNAQSRNIEESLIQKGIPYRIYGGLKFFERAEIKDALSYLRLIQNQDDDAAFERIVNTPTRGIGEKSLDTIRQVRQQLEISLWQACEHVLAEQLLKPRAHLAIDQFMQLILNMKDHIKHEELDEQVEHVIKTSGLLAHYKQDKSEKAQSKVENLSELITAAKQFAQAVGRYTFHPEDIVSQSVLADFLSHAVLESGEHQSTDQESCVQLMTLHSAKGLEFPVVFLCGVEEGLFPHHMSKTDPKRLEEERRLCYVGMTRAMHELTLSYAESRRLHGRTEYHYPSRFVKDIPTEFIKEIRLKSVIQKPASILKSQQENQPWMCGQLVRHPKFGEGTVLNIEGQGPQARIQINFDRAGTKWLALNVAKLEPA